MVLDLPAPGRATTNTKSPYLYPLKELERLTVLTEQYLSIARHRTAKIEVEDLCNVIRESAEFMQRPIVEMLVWMRVPGDTIFSIGAVALAWFVFRLWVVPTREVALPGVTEAADA